MNEDDKPVSNSLMESVLIIPSTDDSSTFETILHHSWLLQRIIPNVTYGFDEELNANNL